MRSTCWLKLQAPSQSPPTAESSAPIALVPVHECSESLETERVSVRSAVSGCTVWLTPSTRTVTLAGPAASAGAARTSEARPAARPEDRICFIESHPFPRGLIGFAVGGGLLAPG